MFGSLEGLGWANFSYIYWPVADVHFRVNQIFFRVFVAAWPSSLER